MGEVENNRESVFIPNNTSPKNQIGKKGIFFIISFFILGPISILWAPSEVFGPEEEVILKKPSPIKIIIAIISTLIIPSFIVYMLSTNINIWETGKPNIRELIIDWVLIFCTFGYIFSFVIFPNLRLYLKKYKTLLKIIYIPIVYIAIEVSLIVARLPVLNTISLDPPYFIAHNKIIIMSAFAVILSFVTYALTKNIILKRISFLLLLLVILQLIPTILISKNLSPFGDIKYGSSVPKINGLVADSNISIGYSINLYPQDNHWQSIGSGFYLRVFSQNGYRLEITRDQSGAKSFESFVNERSNAFSQIISCGTEQLKKEKVKHNNWDGVKIVFPECTNPGRIEVLIDAEGKFYNLEFSYSLTYQEHINTNLNRENALKDFDSILKSLYFK